MKLSKEIVELESKKKLDFKEEYNRITSSDPEFAKILEYFEEMMMAKATNYFGILSLTNHAGEETLLIRDNHAVEVLHRFALNIHRIMSVQAEIDEVERECGTKED